MRSLLQDHKIYLPFFIWPLAVIAGIVIAGGSLSYAPYGRINILWVWLIWAGLPALGSLFSLLFILVGSNRPWLFRLGRNHLRWYPTPGQRLHMIWLVQMLWCLVALGMLMGYLVLLLFSDLAFGWSSTILEDRNTISRAVHWLALPWWSLWPAAVPTESLVAATQYQRVVPGEGDPAMAGQWWRFLMASLLLYNLLPRAVLAGIFYGRWWWSTREELTVRGNASVGARGDSDAPFREDVVDHWRSAVPVHWEYPASGDVISFGEASWSEDENTMAKLLERRPDGLLWQVKAERSPVAELADLIALARGRGINRQALWVHSGVATDPARHLASWHVFARQHGLVWITDFAGTPINSSDN